MPGIVTRNSSRFKGSQALQLKHTQKRAYCQPRHTPPARSSVANANLDSQPSSRKRRYQMQCRPHHSLAWNHDLNSCCYSLLELQADPCPSI